MRRGATAAASVACGALCALCVGLYASSVQAEADEAREEALERYGGEQLEVCVAARDLAPGETIEESDVEMTLWLVDLLTDDAVYDLDEAVGQTVSSTIYAGEVISSARFGAVGSDLDVPDGMVAVSVPAEDVQAVGGAVGSGMQVDLYATGSSTTSLLASGVLVLATSAGESDEEEVTWITLAVEPQLAQSVVAAAQVSELYFTIPADDVESDVTVAAATAATQADDEDEESDAAGDEGASAGEDAADEDAVDEAEQTATAASGDEATSGGEGEDGEEL